MVFKVDNMYLGYNKKTVVENISFQINKGEIVTFIGANGCGKSTILKALCRFIKPMSGNIYLFDKDINKINTKEIAKKIAILPQIRATTEDYLVETLVGFGRYPHTKTIQGFTKEDINIVNWAIEKTGIENLRHRMLAELSGGERQRVWIAMALAQNPEVLILDEPTTYLDVSYQIEVLELIKELNGQLGITIIMVLHDLNLASRYSHRIIAIKEGCVYKEGNVRDIMTKKLIKDIFNVESDILEDETNKCPYFIPNKSIK